MGSAYVAKMWFLIGWIFSWFNEMLNPVLFLSDQIRVSIRASFLLVLDLLFVCILKQLIKVPFSNLVVAFVTGYSLQSLHRLHIYSKTKRAALSTRWNSFGSWLEPHFSIPQRSQRIKEASSRESVCYFRINLIYIYISM